MRIQHVLSAVSKMIRVCLEKNEGIDVLELSAIVKPLVCEADRLKKKISFLSVSLIALLNASNLAFLVTNFSLSRLQIYEKPID